MRLLARNWDFILFALILGGFSYVAAQRLGEVPVPQTDEAYTLQVPYEMLNRGKLALPMLRYLGGNIENVWHSYTPVYFLLLSGFFKVFGWGLVEGRAFNLITALLTLLMVYVIGRRLFNWRAGLIATVMLVSDQTFLERSRLLRNDFAAAAFAMLAFHLFYIAEQRKRPWLYIASGLAVGAGVMCHTNTVYIFGVIGLLMFVRRGWRLVKTKEALLIAGSALLVMSYELIYILIDWTNFLVQNRDDRLHFNFFSLSGLKWNLLREGFRYLDWIEGGNRVAYIPLTLLHIFQVLAAIAVVYLLVRWIHSVRRGEARWEPRVMVLTAAAGAVVFMAVVSGNKAIYYLAHLAPWFALCVGVMLSDLFGLAERVRNGQWQKAKPVYAGILVIAAFTTIVYGRALVRQQQSYLKEVRRQDRVLFDELKTVLGEVVPDDLCPVAMKSPEMWLAFPEEDRCFASIEPRMRDKVDIEGNEYALIMPNLGTQRRDSWKDELDGKYPIIGTLRSTVYGNIDVYYTGKNSIYGLVSPKTYYFFGRGRGHFTDEQLAQAVPVWSLAEAGSSSGADETEESIFRPPSNARGISLVEVASLELEKDTIYQLNLETEAVDSQWELVAVDMVAGFWVLQRSIVRGPSVESDSAMFKTTGTNRVMIALRPLEPESKGSVKVRQITIKRVARLWSGAVSN